MVVVIMIKMINTFRYNFIILTFIPICFHYHLRPPPTTENKSSPQKEKAEDDAAFIDGEALSELSQDIIEDLASMSPAALTRSPSIRQSLKRRRASSAKAVKSPVRNVQVSWQGNAALGGGFFLMAREVVEIIAFFFVEWTDSSAGLMLLSSGFYL